MNTKDLGIELEDWVMATTDHFVPVEIDTSTYVGLPAIVKEIRGDRVRVYSPLKIFYGKPPFDEIPVCQLVKLDPKFADEFVRRIMSEHTYETVNARCDINEKSIPMSSDVIIENVLSTLAIKIEKGLDFSGCVKLATQELLHLWKEDMDERSVRGLCKTEVVVRIH